MSGLGDVHNEFGGTAYGPVVQGRDIGQVNIWAPVSTGTAAALDEAAAALGSALREQWEKEAERLRLGAPDPLPVRWELSPDAGDHWENVRRSPDDQPLPETGELQGITDLYQRVPSGRLVVLGRAGSGKSVLAIRFVLDQLGAPGTAVPARLVPVFFSLGSWNPETPLRDWLVDQLERDHPGLAAACAGLTVDGPRKPTLAEALVHHGRILPVLDGFDEIALALRRSALAQLGETAQRRMPLLLTSRSDEYDTAHGVLAGAAAIKLVDLAFDDVQRYLPLTSKATGWNDVLRRSHDTPLAEALRTPLMVALARTVYSDDRDHDPQELVDKFATSEALENHLLDKFIVAAYRDKSDPYRDRVRGWLGDLARHLDELDTQDLEWWQLGSTLRRPLRVVVVGLVAGLMLGLVDGLVSCLASLAVLHDPVIAIENGLTNGGVLALVSGLVFALMYAFLDGGVAREPARVRMRFFGGATRSRKTYVTRLAAGSVGGAGFGLVTWLVNSLVYDFLHGSAPTAILHDGVVNGVAGAVVGGLLLGFAYAGGADEASGEPLRFAHVLREFQRRLAPRLAIGFAAGFGGGLVFWFVVVLVYGSLVSGAPGGLVSLTTVSLKGGILSGLEYGLIVGLAYGVSAALVHPVPIGAAVSPSAVLKTDRRAVVHQSLVNMLIFVLMGGLFYGSRGDYLSWLVLSVSGGLGIGVAYAFGLTAWGHWVILARTWLPLTGHLPGNPDAFLKDAHRRGVLRQVGAVYQFRHARLQERLTEKN